MPANVMQGPLVYVMGPSGAGKDSVMGRARALLPAAAPVIFAHRYIPRPAATGGANHVALSSTDFALADAQPVCFHWQAHGNDYGIGREIYAWRNAGLTVVVSGSREHFQKVGGSMTTPISADHGLARTAGRAPPRGARGCRRRRERIGAARPMR